jgi:twitching motility protein PilT
MLDLDALLRHAVEQRASDVHLKVGARPFLRVDGNLREGPFDTIDPADTERLVAGLLPAQRAEAFRAGAEVDFVHAVPGLGRFRVSAFRQRGYIGVVLRRVVPGVPGLEALGLPPVIADLASVTDGLVLVTGLAGSGRTSTIAAMVDHVNERQTRHIVTIEEPLEVLHPDKKSIVDQREVGTDTASFFTAMTAVRHQDPDVIVATDINDADTAFAVLEAGDTGRLVFAGMATVGAADTITRLLDLLPPERHDPVRLLLGRVLRGVVCQRLVPRAGGRGRAPAIEVMVVNPPIAEALVDPLGYQRLDGLIAEGDMYGMQTYDQSLARLYARGLVEREVAIAHARHAPSLQVLLEVADRERAAAAGGPIGPPLQPAPAGTA